MYDRVSLLCGGWSSSCGVKLASVLGRCSTQLVGKSVPRLETFFVCKTHLLQSVVTFSSVGPHISTADPPYSHS